MHDCSHTGDHLLDLVLHEINVEDSRDLLSEIEACKECFGNYQAMLRTLQVFDTAVEATLPQESYWHNYNKKLQSRLAQAAPLTNHRRWFSAFTGFRFSPSLSLAGKLATALMILAVGLWAGIQLLNKPVNPPPVAQDQPAGNPNLATPPSPVAAAGVLPSTGDKKNQVRLSGGQVTKSRMGTEEAVKLRRAAAPVASSTNPERTSGRYAVAKESHVAMPVNIEVAEHVEDMRLLLQSFRNARSSKNSSDIDISFEKRLARRMLNQNAFFRREAGSKKHLLVEELLADFEPFLLDVANLPDRSSQENLRSINDLYGKGVLLALNLVELRM
jgi:hypothetical protein